MEFPESLEDYAQPEIGLAAAVVVVLLSPRVRRGLRWGLVQGLSGLLAASDSIVALAHRLTPATQHASDTTFRQQLIEEARIEQAKWSRAHTAVRRQSESLPPT
jgi:hypothetical protein